MIFKRILIPLDGSELAEQVVPHLQRFFAPNQVEIILMAASSPALAMLGDFSQPSSDPALPATSDPVRARIQALTQQLTEQGFKATAHFLVGSPSECILRLAEEEHVDLIAMSTHGRTGIGRALLGSVSDQVVRNARPPVFLVPAAAVAKPEKSPEDLLVPLDGSQFAETALPIAQSFAQMTATAIQLLRVIEPATTHERELMYGNADSLSAVFQTRAKIATNYLEQIRLRLQLAGIPSSHHVVFGKPAAAIAQIASSEEIDLIVMSTHGRSGVERLVYGSIASQVIHDATCPLLLMHGQETIPVQEPAGNVAPATSVS
ncbi:MAG: universal stress protein [Caldilineaceae bacterium]